MKYKKPMMSEKEMSVHGNKMKKRMDSECPSWEKGKHIGPHKGLKMMKDANKWGRNVEANSENIRKDIRAIIAKYQGKVNFEEWDKPEDSGRVTMMRAIMTFRIEL